MSVEQSKAFPLIVNLRAAADSHKATCRNSSCVVSIWLLREAAVLLRQAVWIRELHKVDQLLESWPI